MVKIAVAALSLCGYSSNAARIQNHFETVLESVSTAGGFFEATEQHEESLDRTGDCPFPSALRGRFTGEIMVGTGATACVFIASDQAGRPVAVKVAKQASFMSMWQGECGQMQQIRLKSCWAGEDKYKLVQQYLPTCIELGIDGQYPWYVMHAAGRTGIEEIGGQFSVDDAKMVFSQTVAGIYALHGLDYSHNDLHGKNIVLDGTQLAVIDFGEIRPLAQAQRGPGLKRDANAIWTFGALLADCQCRGPACQADEKDATLSCIQEKWNPDTNSMMALTQLMEASASNSQEQNVEGVFNSDLVQHNLPDFTNQYPWDGTDGCESWNWEDGSHPRVWESTECLEVPHMVGKCPIGSFPGACYRTDSQPWMCWAPGQDFTNTFCEANGFAGACKYADFGREIPEERLDSCEEMGECGMCGGNPFVACYVNDKTGIPLAGQCVCASRDVAESLSLLRHGCKTYRIGVPGDRAYDGVCRFTGAPPAPPPLPAPVVPAPAPVVPVPVVSAPVVPGPVMPVIRPPSPPPSSDALASYTLHQNSRCGGMTIPFWSDGSITFYGDSFQDDLPGCAAMCNAHEECAGFVHKSNGKCSYWKTGPLALRPRNGYDCYAK